MHELRNNDYVEMNPAAPSHCLTQTTFAQFFELNQIRKAS
jgi:hypothetical protein